MGFLRILLMNEGGFSPFAWVDDFGNFEERNRENCLFVVRGKRICLGN